MLLLKILVIALLLVLFMQDVKSRSAHWVLFPALAVLLVALRLMSHQSPIDIWPPTLINCGFLLLQLALVSAWFSLKNGRWVNIANQLLGWGDILFLTAISFYLSVLNFLFFYIISLIAVLFCWLIWQRLVKRGNRHIPLAGIQAFAFAVFLVGGWWFLHLDVTGDDWVLRLITR